MQQIYAKFGAEAFVHRARGPEDRAARRSRQVIPAEPRLAPYAFYLRDIIRRAAHTLSDSEEKILADAAPLAGSAEQHLHDSRERRFPVSHDHARRRQDRQGRSGRIQRAAHVGESCRQTGGHVGVLQRARWLQPYARRDDELERAEGVVLRESRRYSSNLEASLNGPNIPVSVYMRLVDGVNRHLPTFHRYLRLRKRMTGAHR